MLLRSVIEHVKTQNWTAVVLDFLIVVVGVFIGIQVANWNAQLNDRQRAASYVQRLTHEMEINRQTLIGRKASYISQIDNGLYAMDTTAQAVDEESAWKLIRSFFQASRAFTIAMQRGTYDEIISSGDLALIWNQELVNALSDFYTFSGFSTISVMPPYRENVRRLIPSRLQRYLQNECYQITLPDNHHLVDCPPPEGFDYLVDLANQLQANEMLKQDLNYMLSYAGVSADIANNRKNRAEAVLALLAKKSP